jgi:hypothetical protein
MDMFPSSLNELGIILMVVAEFVLGKIHRTMGWVYLLLLTNLILSFAKTKKRDVLVTGGYEKATAYTAFIIMGNVLDQLLVNELIGWKGSTQFSVCLWLVSRELGLIRDYLNAKYKISIPILNERIGQLSTLGTKQDGEQPAEEPAVEVDQKIAQLKEELSKLENSKHASGKEADPKNEGGAKND